jgi:hypothetical protein
MDGIIRYCIVKKYSGILNKKHKSNTHLFFIPVDPKKYMYLALVGQLTEEDDTYAAQLLVKLQEEIIDDTITGEHEYFGNRFVEIESIKCHSTNPSPGNYVIKLLKKGINIRSNLEIQYQVEYSTVSRRIYLVKGDLNLVTGEVTEKDMKMVASKQAAFMGDKERFEEMKKIKFNNRRIKYYHD